MSGLVYIVTASDANFFGFLRGAVESVLATMSDKAFRLCVLDVGLSAEQRSWVNSRADFVASPSWPFDFPGRDSAPNWLVGLLSRPYLPDILPGAEIYFWLDADAMVLDWSAVDQLVLGARRRGMAIVSEVDRGSRLQYGVLPANWRWIQGLYANAFGPDAAGLLSGYPLLNAGVFAIHRDAPHWREWRTVLQVAANSGVSAMTDQIALNFAIYRRGLFERTELLPARCNWGCHMGVPAWDLSKERFVEPCFPNDPIGILHLSGPVKEEIMRAPVVSGGTIPVRMRYSPQPCRREIADGPLLVGDYVSPGLTVVMPDTFFPHMVKGDPNNCQWPFLRRDVPHRWFVDERSPTIGFINRDESAILYNSALRFRGQRALESK